MRVWRNYTEQFFNNKNADAVNEKTRNNKRVENTSRRMKTWKAKGPDELQIEILDYTFKNDFGKI